MAAVNARHLLRIDARRQTADRVIYLGIGNLTVCDPQSFIQDYYWRAFYRRPKWWGSFI